MTPSEKTDLFVKYSKRLCRKHGVSLRFFNSKYVSTDGQDKVQGYFYEGDDEEKAKVSIAKENPRTDWLGTLCHELGHMFQWLEYDITYMALDYGHEKGRDAATVYEDLDEKIDTRHEAMQLVLANELDAERRALDLIIKWDLPITPLRYIQTSNAILYYHHIFLDTGQWASKGTLNSNRLLRKMPSTFDNNYAIIPNDIKELMMSINNEKEDKIKHANI
jgi:hypothetical protein